VQTLSPFPIAGGAREIRTGFPSPGGITMIRVIGIRAQILCALLLAGSVLSPTERALAGNPDDASPGKAKQTVDLRPFQVDALITAELRRHHRGRTRKQILEKIEITPEEFDISIKRLLELRIVELKVGKKKEKYRLPIK
jgi:hypothetical protein